MKTQSDLKRARGLRNLRKAKDFLQMSWRELSEQIQKKNGRGHYSHSELIAWTHNDRTMPEAAMNRVVQLIANKLTARYGREICIRFSHDSPWRVVPVVWCIRCGKYHELKRANQKCRKARQ